MKIFKEELTYMKPLPIGVDDFKKLIDKNYYYVDKTLLIKELLDKKGEVTAPCGRASSL